jgi:hypothetical protein
MPLETGCSPKTPWLRTSLKPQLPRLRSARLGNDSTFIAIKALSRQLMTPHKFRNVFTTTTKTVDVCVARHFHRSLLASELVSIDIYSTFPGPIDSFRILSEWTR